MSDENAGSTASAETGHRPPPPVMPAEMVVEYAEGVLFSDPELTVWWWNSHDFMTNQQRLLMAQKILPLCTSKPCQHMFRQVNAELSAYLGPVSSGDAVANGIRDLVTERPYFSSVVGIALGYLVISAGMNLFDLLMRFGAK